VQIGETQALIDCGELALLEREERERAESLARPNASTSEREETFWLGAPRAELAARHLLRAESIATVRMEYCCRASGSDMPSKIRGKRSPADSGPGVS
jgi:hypothetical protein